MGAVPVQRWGTQNNYITVYKGAVPLQRLGYTNKKLYYCIHGGSSCTKMGYTNKNYITVYMGAVPLQRWGTQIKNYITVYKGAVPLNDGAQIKNILLYTWGGSCTKMGYIFQKLYYFIHGGGFSTKIRKKRQKFYSQTIRGSSSPKMGVQ